MLLLHDKYFSFVKAIVQKTQLSHKQRQWASCMLEEPQHTANLLWMRTSLRAAPSLNPRTASHGWWPQHFLQTQRRREDPRGSSTNITGWGSIYMQHLRDKPPGEDSPEDSSASKHQQAGWALGQSFSGAGAIPGDAHPPSAAAWVSPGQGPGPAAGSNSNSASYLHRASLRPRVAGLAKDGQRRGSWEPGAVQTGGQTQAQTMPSREHRFLGMPAQNPPLPFSPHFQHRCIFCASDTVL